MLEANKKRWFEKLFYLYNLNLLRRRFNSFQVSDFEHLLNREKHQPTIIYCNHSSWWDGLAVFHLSQKAKLDFFVMMEEKQLKDLQLFRKLGAFSVVRENPREGLKSINYAVKLLRENPDRTLCLFPQGEILPNDARPIEFFNGLSRIIEEINDCHIFSIAMRYEFLGDFKPDIFLKIENVNMSDNSKNLNSKELTKKLADKITINLNELNNDILESNFKKYQNII